MTREHKYTEGYFPVTLMVETIPGKLVHINAMRVEIDGDEVSAFNCVLNVPQELETGLPRPMRYTHESYQRFLVPKFMFLKTQLHGLQQNAEELGLSEKI